MFNVSHDSLFSIGADRDDSNWSFELFLEELDVVRELLGELNIRNILVCACLCLRLGLSAEQIARGIKKIHPVEHRLQLIPNPGGMTVIDDAFNSNIRGAEQAFKVLKEMSGNRILVTPGMVELGDMEAEMNRNLGRAAAGCCDTAILVGKKRSEAIASGLLENGFRKENIIVANSLEEAAELLKARVKPGDTVLFENDPDNATAPARKVYIRDVMDDNLDINTFQLHGFTLAGHAYQLPEGRDSFNGNVVLDLGDAEITVAVAINIDSETRELIASFTAIDPETGFELQDLTRACFWSTMNPDAAKETSATPSRPCRICRLMRRSTIRRKSSLISTTRLRHRPRSIPSMRTRLAQPVWYFPQTRARSPLS